MTMEYIRKTYSVPAKRGGRIRYLGNATPVEGTIVRADGARLYIRMDGEREAFTYHPTWALEYL